AAFRSIARALISSAIPVMSGCCMTRSPMPSASCARAAWGREAAMPESNPFRVALSSDFRQPDGSPTFRDFDLAPLKDAAGVEMAFLDEANPLRADQLADFDALILLAHRLTAESIPANGRLAVVARFGVGYDTVDVPA